MIRSYSVRIIMFSLGFLLLAIVGWFFLVVANQVRQEDVAAGDGNNADVVGRLKAAIADKDAEIERLGKMMQTGPLFKDPFLTKQVIEFENREAQLKDAKLRSKIRLDELKAKAKPGYDTLERISSAIDGWDQRIRQLLSDDDGKRIATDPILVESAAVLLDNKKSTREYVINTKANLDGLLEASTKAAEERPHLTPSSGVFEDVDRYLQAAKAVLEAWETDRRSLEALMQEAKGKDPGTIILAEAIKERIAARDRARTEAVAKAQSLAFEETSKKLADVQAALIRQKALMETAKLEEAAHEARIREQANLVAQAAKREKEALIQKYENALPDIKSYLAAFISPGYAQPRGTALETTDKKGPMSYGRLKAAGALKPGTGGLKTLTLIGSAFTNDRNKSRFPEFLGSDAEWRKIDQAFIQRAQEMLIEFGPLMVEKGLLAE